MGRVDPAGEMRPIPLGSPRASSASRTYAESSQGGFGKRRGSSGPAKDEGDSEEEEEERGPSC